MNIQQLPSKLWHRATRPKGIGLTIHYVLPVILLLTATIYSGCSANALFSTNSDALVNPYFFDNFRLHDMIVPGGHTLVLKWPLFILQTILPYNFTFFTLVNLSLLIVTIGTWAGLLIYIFGKRFTPLICLALTCIILSSTVLTINLLETTIRNIEYPIGLGFLLAIQSILVNDICSRKKYVIVGVISLLYGLSAAGDTLQIIAFGLPALVVVGLFWLAGRSKNKYALQSAGYVIATLCIVYIIRYAISASGVTSLYSDPSFDLKVAPFDQVLPSVATAFYQTLSLMGADIFDKSVSVKNSVYFLNFILVFVGTAGLWVAFRESVIKTDRKTVGEQHSFIYCTLLFGFILTFFSYAVSGLVLTRLPQGGFADAGQIRYLTLLPLLIVVGIAYIIKTLNNSRVFIFALAALMTTVILSLPTLVAEHNITNNLAAKQTQIVTNIVSVARKNNIALIASGYWYGATTRFWSQDEVKYVSKSSCNYPWPQYNMRKSWYTPSENNIKSALLIDRSGVDKDYWLNCSDDQIIHIYGQPSGKETIEQGSGKQPIEFWIYDYDIRSRLLPI